MSETKKKEVKKTVVQFEALEAMDFSPPSRFYILDALGQYVFFHCRSRDEAQKECNSVYGIGKYVVRASKIEKGSGEYTCTGSSSRKGMGAWLRPTV